MLVLHWLILDRECKLRSPSRMRGPRLRAKTGFPLPRERTEWVNAKQQWSSAGAA
jgi:hypothetical protein